MENVPVSDVLLSHISGLPHITILQVNGTRSFTGREVNDFRSVDYEAISMLNVSATQELARKIQALEKENAALKSQLLRQAEAVEARLSRLEESQRAAAPNAPLKVALQKK